MILPDEAHVAFDKGAHYLGVEVVRDHIGPRTILLVGSADDYPYGTVDPSGALSELAVENEVEERFGRDLSAAAAYAGNPDQSVPRSGAIYGGQRSRARGFAREEDSERDAHRPQDLQSV